ncbi:MAG: hypothetical protein IPJ32_14440 [Sphingobacteriaceae bacterium]|nr:hypothetical protein [Sphingobacteriaceae bacterium]
MKSIGKYRMNLKRFIALNILLFNSLITQAGFADKAKNAISKEFNSFEGIWIMLGLIGGGLGIYVIMNQVNKRQAAKEAAEDAARGTSGVQHSHRRHHRHKVVKK